MAKHRHHEIPEHYLRGFTEAGTSFVWVFDRKLNFYRAGPKRGVHNPARLGVRVTALRQDAYEAWREDGTRHFEFERELSAAEQRANPILEKVRSHRQLCVRDRDALASYIYLMWKRRYRRDVAMEATVEQTANESRRKAADLARRGRFREARAIFDEADHMTTVPGRTEYLRRSMIEDAGLVRDELLRRNWRILRATAPEYFLTSDCPVLIDLQQGLAQSPLIFPVSQEHCLIIDLSKGDDTAIENVGKDFVPNLNGIIIGNSHAEIYSPHPDEWIFQQSKSAMGQECDEGNKI
jgi:PHD/YefM family antitoxin component YafN of YafNO toxin-antitoxin module